FLYRDDLARLAPRLQMLVGAIKRGVLAADHHTNALISIGNYDRSEVSRSDLKVFAQSIGERPAFLFYNDPLPTLNGPRVSKAPPPVPTVNGRWIMPPPAGPMREQEAVDLAHPTAKRGRRSDLRDAAKAKIAELYPDGFPSKGKVAALIEELSGHGIK